MGGCGVLEDETARAKKGGGKGEGGADRTGPCVPDAAGSGGGGGGGGGGDGGDGDEGIRMFWQHMLGFWQRTLI